MNLFHPFNLLVSPKGVSLTLFLDHVNMTHKTSYEKLKMRGHEEHKAARQTCFKWQFQDLIPIPVRGCKLKC